MASYVVCVDGSTNSDNGVRLAHACTTAADHIVVCCVADSVDCNLSTVAAVAIATDLDVCASAGMDGECALQIASAASSVLKGDRKVSSVILVSASPSAARAVCDKYDGQCDVIVVGSRGLGLASQFILGSFSTSLVAYCKQSSVIITPPDANLDAFDGCVRYLCLVDGSGQSLRCIQRLARLLHPEDSVWFMNCVPHSACNETRTALLQAGEDHTIVAAHEYKKADGCGNVSAIVEEADDVGNAALRIADDFPNRVGGPITCIAIGSRGLGTFDPRAVLFGSTARTLLAGRKHPVLIITTN